MIVYRNILGRLKEAGYTTSRLRREKILAEITLTAIRNGHPVNTTTIDTICRLLQCQPGDILEYRENTPEE